MDDYWREELIDIIPEEPWNICYPSDVDWVVLAKHYNSSPDKFSYCNISPRFTNYFENPEENILDEDDKKSLDKWEKKYKFLYRLKCNNDNLPKPFLGDCNITEFYDEVVPIVYQIK